MSEMPTKSNEMLFSCDLRSLRALGKYNLCCETIVWDGSFPSIRGQNLCLNHMPRSNIDYPLVKITKLVLFKPKLSFVSELKNKCFLTIDKENEFQHYKMFYLLDGF